MTQVNSTDIKTALAKKHWREFFLTECKSGSTWLTPKGDMKILDALAIRKSWTNQCFTGYEVKISRGDFLRDAKFYTYEELCNCLYVVCPKGMIERTELPESVGLIYYDPDTKNLVTRKKAIYRDITYSPELLLYIIYSRLDSDRIPFYSSAREYFEDYIQNKDLNRRIGAQVSSKLIKENNDLKSELERVSTFQRDYKDHKAILEICQKHGIYSWRSDLPSLLDKALTRQCPEGLDEIRKDLEYALNTVKRMEDKQAEASTKQE